MSSTQPDLSSSEQIRQDLLRLNAERNKIESEMRTFRDILLSQNVGMNESLVDNEGFPRNDIDIYQVRIARNKIVTLETDARQIMKQIETLLHRYHELNAPQPMDPPER